MEGSKEDEKERKKWWAGKRSKKEEERRTEGWEEKRKTAWEELKKEKNDWKRLVEDWLENWKMRNKVQRGWWDVCIYNHFGVIQTSEVHIFGLLEDLERIHTGTRRIINWESNPQPSTTTAMPRSQDASVKVYREIFGIYFEELWYIPVEMPQPRLVAPKTMRRHKGTTLHSH